LIDCAKFIKAVGAEIMALPKFWSVVFRLANVSKLDGGVAALARFNVPNNEESLTILQ